LERNDRTKSGKMRTEKGKREEKEERNKTRGRDKREEVRGKETKN
jgi:hypothetical protein